MKKNDIDFEIDEELRNALPILSHDEKDALFALIDEDGIIIDPLVIGVFPDGKRILIDGYNRYEYIKEHSLIEFTIKEKNFENKYEAIDWMITNQLARRNIQLITRDELIRRQYEIRKKSHGNNAERDESGQYTGDLMCNCCTSGEDDNTASQIADEQGVSRRTVYNAINRSEGLDRADKARPGFKDKVLSGELNVPTNICSDLNEVSDENIDSVLDALENGNKQEARDIIARDYIEQNSTDDENDEIDDIFDGPTMKDIQEFKDEIDNAINKFKNVLGLKFKKIAPSADARYWLEGRLTDIQDIVTEYNEEVKSYVEKYESE